MSMNAWSILGIAPTEDVRAIKRAYSVKLKTCRPEDDAEGFARLRTAYEMVLARAEHMARQRAAQAAREAEAEPPATGEDALPVPATAESVSSPAPIVAAPVLAAPAPPAASAPSVGPMIATTQAMRAPRALAAEIIAQANQYEQSRGLGVLAFTRWLAAHPALVSLQIKQATGHALLAVLAGGASAPQSAVRALSEFFSWDDPLERRRLAQAGLNLDAVAARLELGDLQQWVKSGLARKDVQARRLERICRAGDRGLGVWWLALAGVERFRPLLTLNHVLKQHPYRAVEQYLGASTMRFWQGMYAQVPNRRQWLQGIGQPLLLGMLCTLLLALVLLLTQQDQGVDWRAAFASVATLTLFLTVWNGARLAGRWIKFGAPPAWRERLAHTRRWLGFAPLHWRLLPWACALLVPAWYWPASWSTWPYAIVMCALLMLQARSGWAIVAALIASACGVAILGSMLADQQAQALAFWLTLPAACAANYVHDAQGRQAARTTGGFTISWRTVLAILLLLSILLRGLGH